MFFQSLLFRTHLAEGEKLLFVAHKHWIEIFKISTQTFFFGIVVPWILWALFPPIFWIAVAWSILSQLIYLYSIVDWYFDAWLVTTVSIIDVEWKGIFHHLSSRVEYGDIKEIAYEKKGFLGTMLNYGDMSMGLTSGDHILLENGANPKRTELTIHQLREEYLHAQKMSNADALQEILADIVQNHIQEHGLPPSK